MHAEDLIVDDYTQGEKVKHVGEVVPHVGVAVFPRALRVETVGLGDTARFVVTTNEMNALGVS